MRSKFRVLNDAGRLPTLPTQRIGCLADASARQASFFSASKDITIMSNPKLEVLTPHNSQLIFID
ncbi:hypothetical protein, partial [Burkholderia cenocepacia]|uniref:hypothetical protein n=1 Tax=Burkholderia cenocepacia TaxID=95486 RepID=UPI001F48F1CC